VEQVGAGEVVFFPAKGPPVRRNLTPEQAAAWRVRKLYFDSASLGQVLAEVNRYAAKPLVVENQDIERLMLTGQFPAGDVQSVLLSLRQLYGIEARETADRWLLARTASQNRPRN
jgi:ferric-dicitrate binding protein FerR (iron transport regulator)